jgi:hypothetical protein
MREWNPAGGRIGAGGLWIRRSELWRFGSWQLKRSVDRSKSRYMGALRVGSGPPRTEGLPQ